jgi:hypothetical protein
MRIRKIKQYGNTYVIALKPSDLTDLNLKVGNSVDIGEIVPIKERK